MRKSMFCLLVATLVPVSAVRADWDSGVAAFKAKNYPEAIKQFKVLVEVSPSPQGFLMLGNSYLKAGQAAPAVDALKKAMELQPDAQTTVLLAQAYSETARYRDCASTLSDSVLAGLPATLQSSAYKIKSGCSAKGGGDPTADRKKLAALAPNDAAAQFAYGVAALQAGNAAEAAGALSKAVKINGSEPKYRKAYVQALIRQARIAGGAAKLEHYKTAVANAQALVAAQTTFDNVLMLGEVQMGAKMYDLAVGTFEKAAGLKAGDYLPHFYIGQSRAAADRFADSEAPLQKALSLAAAGEDKAKIYNQLGYVYAKQNKHDQAIEAYNRGGNTTEAQRVAQNKQIAAENAAAEKHNATIEQIKAEQEKLKKEMEALPGGPPR